MPRPDRSLLACRSLTVRVPGRELVTGFDLSLAAGELVAILGRNGTGKTLTLHTLAGQRAPDEGELRLGGTLLAERSRREIAQRLALLPQHYETLFPATVMEAALIGRHPHIGPWQWESARDRRITREALAAVGLAALEEREVATLSGGERRRLAIARVLAQAPSVYLLDEPTNHLDPQHQIEALNLFRKLARDGAAVATSLHDVNLAARYADRCLLLHGDGRWQLGATAQVLTERNLSELYETPMAAVAWNGKSLFVAEAANGPEAFRPGAQ